MKLASFSIQGYYIYQEFYGNPHVLLDKCKKMSQLLYYILGIVAPIVSLVFLKDLVEADQIKPVIDIR